MSYNDQLANLVSNIVSERSLEHSGVKGMKWGTRKAVNALSRASANVQTKKISKVAADLATRAKGEKIATKVTGNGLSTARTVAGTAIHAVSRNGVGKKLNTANQANYVANKTQNKSLARNAKYAAKLKNKVDKKSGVDKAKAQKKLDAWNAYSKVHAAKIAKASAKTNTAYTTVANAKASMDRSHNQKVNNINKGVYGKNKHGDTNQILQTQQNKLEKAGKVAKAAYGGAKTGGPTGAAASALKALKKKNK